MAIVVFLTLALAIWHFTVFLPERFWLGIIGALLAAILGALFSGLVLQTILGRSLGETDALTLLLPLPGIILFLALAYFFPRQDL